LVATRDNVLGRVSGFTLLELLIVLAIAGALAALVPPVVSAVVPGTKARVAALDLAATLRDARNAAITSSQTIDVEFDFEKSTYTVAGEAVNELPRGMAVAMLDFSGYGIEDRPTARVFQDRGLEDKEKYTLRFFSDGSSNGIRARLGNESGGYVVAVDWLLGRVTIEEARRHAS
jgi:general secretion pathway protein H